MRALCACSVEDNAAAFEADLLFESLRNIMDSVTAFEAIGVGSIPTGGAKVCSTCHLEKEIGKFPWRNKHKGTRAARCKECQKDFSVAHYTANRPSYYARNERRRREVCEYVERFKAKPCEDCGNEYAPRAMDFHHEGDDKIDLVSRLKHQTTLPKVKREIAKCIVLCAVCHRLRH